MKIKDAKAEDAKVYVEHLERVFNSNGKDGRLFSPREAGTYQISQENVEAVTKRWRQKIGEPGYEKAWLLWDEDKVVGHTLLTSMQLPSALHRLDLEIGIEEKYRDKGLGKKLTETAIKWARDYKEVAWIDLMVFANNKSAISLYKSFGFTEVGRLEDRFRLCNKSVDDISMVLKVTI